MKYYISLYSKYTGERIVLGSKYDTQESAIEYAEKNVCTKCNSYKVSITGNEYQWIDKHRGFVPPASIKKIREEDELKRKAIAQVESMFSYMSESA